MDLVLLSSLHFVWDVVLCCDDSLLSKGVDMLNLTWSCVGTFFWYKSCGFRLHWDVGNLRYEVKTNPLPTVCILVVLIIFENSFTLAFPKQHLLLRHITIPLVTIPHSQTAQVPHSKPWASAAEWHQQGINCSNFVCSVWHLEANQSSDGKLSWCQANSDPSFQRKHRAALGSELTKSFALIFNPKKYVVDRELEDWAQTHFFWFYTSSNLPQPCIYQLV